MVNVRRWSSPVAVAALAAVLLMAGCESESTPTPQNIAPTSTATAVDATVLTRAVCQTAQNEILSKFDEYTTRSAAGQKEQAVGALRELSGRLREHAGRGVTDAVRTLLTDTAGKVTAMAENTATADAKASRDQLLKDFQAGCKA
jgi:hypothetical protein